MKNPKLANRYAQALFDMAGTNGNIEEVFTDITLIKKVLKENMELIQVIESPHIPMYIKNNVFISLFTGKITEITKHFLLLIIKKRRVPEIYSILDQFIQIYQKEHHIKVAKITVSTELNPTLIQKIVTILETELHSKIETIITIDPKIIGGVIIKVDDLLVDGSLISKIKRLKTEFSQNKYQISY